MAMDGGGLVMAAAGAAWGLGAVGPAADGWAAGATSTFEAAG
jgi:hypothetical protein